MSRYCASSLDAIRHAANAVKAGEGDTYIAAGVEWVSRYNERTEPAGAADQNENLQGKDGQPNAYIDMGITAVNVAKNYEVSRADMDKYAQRSQELAVKSQEDGFFDREIVPVDAARRHRGRQGRRPARRARRSRSSPSCPRPSGGGGVTAGNSCPLNDGAAAVLVMSRHQGQGARPDAARQDRHRRHRGQRARVHGRRPDRRDQEGARPRPG